MTVAADNKFQVGETVGIHVTDLNFGLNARYGWGNGNILEAYKAKNEALRQKIEEWGFRKAHSIEAYYDDEGKLTVKHGNRRTFAAKWIHQDNPDEHIAWDLEEPGQIWVTIVEKPNSIIELLEEQVADNEQLAATKLDQLMVYQARVDEIVKSGEAKTPNNAIKVIAKQDYKTKAEKLISLGEAKDLEAAYKVLKKELAAYETQLKKELKVMTLSPEVLSWLQESYLDACEIKLSFGKVNELLTAYADKADLLLKEALKEILLEPRDEYAQNGYLSSRWLDNLARKLGLLEEKEKPQKSQKTTSGASFYAPDDTAKSKSTDNTDDEELEDDDSEITAQPVTRAKTSTSSIQTTATKKRDYYLKEVLKTIDSDLGLVLANDQNVILQEPTPGSYTVTIELPSKEIAQAFEVLINNLKAAFGDQDAAASLEEFKSDVVDNEVEEESTKEPSPLDEVDLGDMEY